MSRFSISIVALALALVSCRPITEFQERRERNRLIREAYRLENSGSYEELEEAASIYRNIISEKINAADRLGYVYQILAERSLKAGHYPNAARYAEEGLRHVSPRSTGMHYLAGVAYGHWAEGTLDESIRAEYVAKAERHLRYAVEHNAGIAKYHAALAVLLSNEKDEHGEALTHIDRALLENNRDIDFLFIKGGILVHLDRLPEAIRTYREAARIATEQNDRDARNQAERNVAELNNRMRQ